jgi:hypothetical protein
MTSLVLVVCVEYAPLCEIMGRVLDLAPEVSSFALLDPSWTTLPDPREACYVCTTVLLYREPSTS